MASLLSSFSHVCLFSPTELHEINTQVVPISPPPQTSTPGFSGPSDGEGGKNTCLTGYTFCTTNIS